MLRTSVILWSFLLSNTIMADYSIIIRDTGSGTIQYPPLQTQIRKLITTETTHFSFMRGDVLHFKTIDAENICISLKDLSAMEEIKRNLVDKFMTPIGSPYPSAIEVLGTESCSL